MPYFTAVFNMRNQITVKLLLWLWALLVVVEFVAAATCSLKPSSTPVTAAGWASQLIVQNLRGPRGIIFDSAGNLLVVEQGSGVVHLRFEDGGGTCLDVASKTYLINSTDLNHGIALSNDGRTLYASSSNSVYSWSYDPTAVTVSSTNTTLVTGMSNSDHTTRTLLISQKQPGILVVSRGSSENIDLQAENINTGHSQLKAFDLNNFTAESSPYDFTTSGRLLGWGLRNSVGVAEEPLTGGIYTVENSADQIQRGEVDIHQNNPGEEMNFHGFLNSSTENQSRNYGYPYCFALWNTSIPNVGSLKVGSQFSLQQNSTVNDTFCGEHVAPRLTFQAHMAPLDILFLPNGTEAFVSFHGSWDRTNPIGYKLSSVAFASGSPVAAADSQTSTTDIFYNKDNSRCPNGCFRPVGLALDSNNRLFMSSDSTGEIYVLERNSQASTTSVAGSTPTKKSSGIKWGGEGNVWAAVFVVGMSLAWAL